MQKVLMRGAALATAVLFVPTVLVACRSSSPSGSASSSPSGSATSSSSGSVAAAGPIDSSKCPASATQTITGDTITLGMTVAQSGPFAAAAPGGTFLQAYAHQINAAGGVKTVAGVKKLKVILKDDQYTPSITQQQVRGLVEKDHVSAMVSSIGSAPDAAVAPYLNSQCVPQLWQSSYSSALIGSATPFTTQLSNYVVKGTAIVKDVIAKKPDATIALLYQSGDLGDGAKSGIMTALKSSQAKLIASQSTQATDTTVQSQMTTLIASKADVFVMAETGPACTQAINAIIASTWRPTVYDNGGCASTNLNTVVGFDKLTAYQPGQFAPVTATTPDIVKFVALCKTAGVTPGDNAEYVYVNLSLTVQTLEAAKTWTQVGIANAAQSLKLTSSPGIIPGLTITSGIGKTPVSDQDIEKWNSTKKLWLATSDIIKGS